MSLLIVVGCAVAVCIAIAASRPRSIAQGRVTRVPVDDFVVGDLPMVCARSGQPADGLVGVESDEGVFQLWWLLLLVFGPFGILAIAILWALTPRPGRVGGSVPMTRAALDAQNRIVSLSTWVLVGPLAALGVGAAFLFLPRVDSFGLSIANESVAVAMLLAGLVGGFVMMAVVSAMASRRNVRVRLDGSGRWVEIRNVHAVFATAVDAQVSGRHRAARDRSPR